MKPLGTRVVIEREVMGEKIGRIIIPEKARHKPQIGRVTQIGEQVTTVTVGDRVLFGKHSTLDVEGHGMFIWEADIIAVLE
jgi:co-chaperonin GroES (HSP10)